MGAQQSAAGGGALNAQVAAQQAAQNNQGSAPISTGNAFPAPMPIKPPPGQANNQPQVQQPSKQQANQPTPQPAVAQNNAQKQNLGQPPQQQQLQVPPTQQQNNVPNNTQNKQNLFKQGPDDKAGFTVQEEWEEDEEYEESQNMFATGFRSALKNNQGSINTGDLNQFNSASNHGGGELQDALRDFKMNQMRQQSQMIQKENLKLPKMTNDGLDTKPVKQQPEVAKPPVQPPQLPQKPIPQQQPAAQPQKLIQPVLTPQPKPPVLPSLQTPPAQPQPKPTPVQQPIKQPAITQNPQQPVKGTPIQETTLPSHQAGVGLSYQSVRQIEEESAGFMTHKKIVSQQQQQAPVQQQRMQSSNQAYQSVRPGMFIQDEGATFMDQESVGQQQNDLTQQLYLMQTSKDRATMKNGGFINGDLPTIQQEEEDMPADIPYTMGDKQFSVRGGLSKERSRPPSSTFQKPMSMQKFNEVNAPPRMAPQTLWPSTEDMTGLQNGGQDMKQDSVYMRKSFQKEVVQSKEIKAQEIHKMSQAIKDAQINDHGSHYSREHKRKTPRDSFPMIQHHEQIEESEKNRNTHRTQTKNLLQQVKHELVHGPQHYEPGAKVDQEDIKDYYNKQQFIKENPHQSAHLLAPNQKKKPVERNSSEVKKSMAPKDDLEQTQVFKNMRQKYDEDLLSEGRETVKSISHIRGSKTPAPQRMHENHAPPPMSHQQQQQSYTRGNSMSKNPYLQVGASMQDEDAIVMKTPAYQLQQQKVVHDSDQDFSRRLNQYAPLDHSMESSKYFPGINDKSGLNKQFGVYTFEDRSTPLFERKARLIERLVVKKDESGNPDEPVNRSKFKVRSIPGGAGHQIVFSNRSEQMQAKQQQTPPPSAIQQPAQKLPEIKARPESPSILKQEETSSKKSSQSSRKLREGVIPGAPPGMIKPFETQQQITQIPNSLPRKLPRYEELQKQKFELQSRRTQQIMANQKIQLDDFKVILWGYLSCADRLELQKLFKMSPENLLIRDYRELIFNQPFPLAQARNSRQLSSLYVAVATGCLEAVNLIFEEMTWIEIDNGIEIRKKYKDENEEIMVNKGEKPIRKRTPLQLACALGLYKIVEVLLSKGANANGIDGSDVTGHTDFYYPPLVICASRKIRQQLLDELVGISIWQVYDNNYEVSHVQCLEALLRNKADANLDISHIAPLKPMPIFYCLKHRNMVAKIVQYGGDVNVTDKEGLTPLCRVVDKPAKSANSDGVGIAEDEEQKQLEVVDTLVGLGKAQTVHCCALNPVLTAIKRGKYLIARYLVVKGQGDVNWRGPGQPSAVQIAIDQDNVMLLEEVLGWPKLESPLDLDYIDPTNGMNIFHRIAKRANLELFTKLVQSGRLHTHPQLLYKALNTPVLGQDIFTLPLLICCPNLDLANAYMREGAGLGGLTFRQCYEQYSTQDPKFLEFLLQESGQLDVNEVDPMTGHTCLITAAEAGDIKKMHFLLRLGADPDARYPEDAEQRLGMTLLHEACLKGKVEQAKLLLQFGANFNLKCHRGRTTLDFLRTGHEQKSNRRREELKTLLYKYTVKSNIFNKQ